MTGDKWLTLAFAVVAIIAAAAWLISYNREGR
jgi:uncharacterized membrane protein